MPNQNNSGSQELEDLLRQMDELLAPPEQEEDDFDVNEYAPAGLDDEEPVVFQNYSNRYGAGPLEKELNSVPAYNADFYGRKKGERPEMEFIRRQDETQKIVIHEEPITEYIDEEPLESPRKVKKPRRRRGRGSGCLTTILCLVLAVVVLCSLVFQPPKSEQSIGSRKRDTATILICGTDWEGARTDTMMLLYLSGSEHQVGLLSLPRDTLTITASGKRAKLNSAYGRNGCGEEGMEWTLNYVEKIIGYRPDGYILVDMELVPRMVDLMGGVDVTLDHHIRVHTDGVEVYVPAGEQHLNGEEVLATLRYRYGYANADLGRVKVQRMVIKECMKQWVTPANLSKLPEALELIQSESLTNLDAEHFLWIGKAILTGINDLTSDTLPGYAQMRGGASYYILYPEKVAELVNEFYNPYRVVIDADDLDIAE